MKRERRHELQHNDLAEWMIKAYERVVPYRNMVLGTSLLVFVLAIALWFWRSHSFAQAAEAWNSLGIPVFQPQFAAEQTIGVMQHTAQTNPGMAAAEWAEVFAGDSALMVGTNKVLTDKKIGIEYLSQAQKLYTDALATITIPAAREQAMFGKARAMESLIQNKTQLDEAVAAYQELKKSFPLGMFQAIADQRIEQLQKKETLKFYEKLAQYSPKPKVEKPHSQLGKLGALPDALPDEPLAPKAPGRAEGTHPSPGPGLPEPTLTPKEPAKPSAQKTEPVKQQPVEPDVLKTEGPKASIPKAETPKPETIKKDK